ncbi:hypothetical protein JCM10213_000583 [Rhodosporidiobolus nylandii]
MVASSSTGPLTVILGATGAQGGSVVNALLHSARPYRIVALSRSTSSNKAQQLREKGCEVVEADVGKKETLEKAFKGAQIVFAMTEFWSDQNAARELEDGKRIVDAAKAAQTVQLFVWSGLEPVREISKGKIREVVHFDSKAAITAYARSSGLPLAVVEPGCYMSNFLSGTLGPHRTANGEVEWRLPVTGRTVVSLLDAQADYGAFVRAAIEVPGLQAGCEVLACAEELTLETMVRQWSEVTGVKATYRQITPAQFLEAIPGSIGVELLEMLQWFEQYGYFGRKSISKSVHALQVKVKTWKEWVKEQKWAVLDEGVKM